MAVYNHYKRIQHRQIADSDIEIEKGELYFSSARQETGQKPCSRGTLAKRLKSSLRHRGRHDPHGKPAMSGEDVEKHPPQACRSRRAGNIEAAERGIIYIDEIDKIARKSEKSIDHARCGVGREGVQQALLKNYRKATIANVPSAGWGASTLTRNT